MLPLQLVYTCRDIVSFSLASVYMDNIIALWSIVVSVVISVYIIKLKSPQCQRANDSPFLKICNGDKISY